MKACLALGLGLTLTLTACEQTTDTRKERPGGDPRTYSAPKQPADTNSAPARPGTASPLETTGESIPGTGR